MSSVVAVRFHETRKCPAGTLAWHPTYGLVDVLQARGWERVVRLGRAPDPEQEVRDVDVRDLELVELGETLGVGFAAYVADEQELRTLVEDDAAELGDRRDWEPVPLRVGRPFVLRD